MNETYCNNCGKYGHIYSNCKIPITSFGIIAFRYNAKKQPEFLMIRRKDTLGFIDFMRGKYLVQNKQYLFNMITQMTTTEKENLRKGDFDALWRILWGDNAISNKYKAEEMVSREKYNMLLYGVFNKKNYFTLSSIIDETNEGDVWEEPEWGFPKGRRNQHEKDFDCAMREFYEETGYEVKHFKNVQNIFPFEEIFLGSNYKSYKHKYYLMYIDYETSLTRTTFEKEEVSKMEWKTVEECMECIRPYNLEKKTLITKIYQCIQHYGFYLS